MDALSYFLMTWLDPQLLLLTALGTMAGIYIGAIPGLSVTMAVSILIGGVLAIVNFRLMKAGIDRMLYPGGKKKDGLLIFGFIGRLLLILLCLFVMIQTAKFNLMGALAGLAIIVLAGMYEALRHFWKS